MMIFTTTEVGQLLGVSAATIKRLSVAGKINCVRSGTGSRGFRLEDIADHLRGQGYLADSLRARSVDGCVAAVVRACRDGATLAQAFDELVIPALEQVACDELSFIERCEPLGLEPCGRSSAPTAIVISVQADEARPRMAACLLRGLGYRVPALSREAQTELLRVVACADPSLVVAVEPHRPDLSLLREHLPPILDRIGGSLLVDGAGGDFETMQGFVGVAYIRFRGSRVTHQIVAVS